MGTTILTIELPEELESVLKASGYSRERLSAETLQSLALTMYVRKILSLEQAARIANMNLWEFIPFLGDHGISVTDYDPEDIQTEIKTAQWLSQKHKK